MNKDQVKGKAKDVMGRAQRQAGEWTDNREQQAKGLARQMEGKGQEVLGDVEQAGTDLKRDLRNRADKRRERDVRNERDRKAA